MDAMGLGYDALKQLNPGIIMINVSGFGQFGPYRNRRAFDPIGQAMAGVMFDTGSEDEPPVRCGPPIIDRITALHATIGALGALHRRDLTGVGQALDVSLLDSAFTLTEIPIAQYLTVGVNPSAMATARARWRRRIPIAPATDGPMSSRFSRRCGSDSAAPRDARTSPMIRALQAFIRARRISIGWTSRWRHGSKTERLPKSSRNWLPPAFRSLPCRLSRRRRRTLICGSGECWSKPTIAKAAARRGGIRLQRSTGDDSCERSIDPCTNRVSRLRGFPRARRRSWRRSGRLVQGRKGIECTSSYTSFTAALT